jgi:hypothetical protein
MSVDLDHSQQAWRADISIVVVTSPSPSNPSVELIAQSIDSCNLVDGLDGCPVIIMMDGFKVGPVDRTKVGRITEDSARRYELYHQALLERFNTPRYRVVRNEKHLGFALTVKAGLELCTTTYCLISQYDRMFCTPFTRLRELIQKMDEDEHIRYIGFPTSTNINHDKFISTNYNLYCLNKPHLKTYMGDNLYLQPLVFWFDSQHIGHVRRYLQIYQPYKNLPAHLREVIGIRSIKGMLLRPGDFIEDRFGQMQRRLLWTLATKGRIDSTMSTDLGSNKAVESSSTGSTEGAEEGSGDEGDAVGKVQDGDASGSSAGSVVPVEAVNMDLVVELFRWYGSYLCWQNTSPTPYDVHLSHDHSDTVVMVRHLRGRQLNSDGIAWKLSTFSEAGASSGGYWKQQTGKGGESAGAVEHSSQGEGEADQSEVDCDAVAVVRENIG